MNLVKDKLTAGLLERKVKTLWWSTEIAIEVQIDEETGKPVKATLIALGSNGVRQVLWIWDGEHFEVENQ